MTFTNWTKCTVPGCINLAFSVSKYCYTHDSQVKPIRTSDGTAPVVIPVGGHKADAGKSPCELLSPIALQATADVLAFGARKYAPNNWRKGLAWSRVIGAILRHTFAIMRGEDLDPETNLPHIDHVACEVMFLQEFYRTRKDLDDRYKADPSQDSTNQTKG